MEVTKAEIDAVLDAQGRFVWTPNALTLDGQQSLACDLQPGESLQAFLRRHVPGIDSGAWSASIGGAMVPRSMWAHTRPKHGMHIACRATVGKQVVQLVAIAALSYFTMGVGAAWIGTTFGVGAAAASAIGMGLFMAGSILINKVLAPKVPKPGEAAAARAVYSLNSQRNSVRAYESLPTLWGEMRVVPDLAGFPYTLFAGDDQYLCMQLLGGINVHSAYDLAVGETPLSSYEDVQVYYNGLPGHASQVPPMYSNVDSIAGAELVTKQGAAGWITRTTSTGTKRVEIDVEGTLFYMNSEGKLRDNSVTLDIAIKPEGSPVWNTVLTQQIVSRSQDTIRRTFGYDLPEGQHEVRVRSSAASNNHDTRASVSLAWVTMRSIQADNTDYSQWGRIAIKIKATGQLSGSLDTVRATYRAKPMPIWTGTEWATATSRENGLCNPGAIILQTLRGVYHNGELQFGFGLSDEQIDIEGLKAFMLYCTSKGYTYDRWLTGQVSLGDFCDEVALAGMGQFSWTDGSRPTVVFVSAGQPLGAVVNMANMLKASFSVDYALSNLADGIEYQYVDRSKGFETQTLRVTAPGVTTMLNPARVTGEGVTTEAHAAVMARYHLAQSLYQYKTIGYTADIEHLDYRRLSVLSISHDLTQWGFGGRLAGIYQSSGRTFVQLDEAVPALSTPHLGLRLPGERDYRVWSVVGFEGESDTLELVGDWPEDVLLPGSNEADPAHDTLWCYDFKATPGYRVRVVSMEPEGDLKGAKVTCVPEGPEFWDYVLNGNYVPAPNQSALPQLARPQIKNLKVREQINFQGDTEWYELHATWDAEGDYDHAQVWAGLDGSEQRLVDANAVASRSSFRIDGAGEWLVTVRPFDKSGRAGVPASVLFITQRVEIAPRNVDQFVVQMLPGGLRRFAWGYTGDQPPALAGVQIRYRAGNDPISVDDWQELTPLGSDSDVYKAQFETTRPPAGLWTFACRAINTAAQLADGVATFTINLDASFEQVQQEDLTPPPEVQGLAMTAGLATAMVSWDVPVYSQGHGHARTEVWAATQDDQQLATKVAEGYAGPVSFNAEPATTYYVWARNVTTDGVPGEWVGPVSGQTGQNPEKLLEVLDGQIKESHLYGELSQRIDIIDKDGGVLGRTLVDAAAHQDALNQSVRTDMNDMAQGLLEAALAADAALERITDAGVYVDPLTGTVKIYGLEVTKDQVTNLQVLLDTLNGQLQLKATTAYVDGKIAEAVLSPADLLLYEGIDARLIAVTQTLDSINGVLASKASQLELTGALARLTTAESTLDALGGQIALRVTRAEYEAGQNAVNSRLGSAELLLSTLDAPSITATVLAAARGSRDAEKSAQALLQDIIAGERRNDEAQQALAFARQDLTAAYQAEVGAEAASRLQLAAQVASQAAAIQSESVARANAIAAEAAQRQTLAAAVGENSSAISQEAVTRANQAGYLGGLYTVRMQLSQGGQQVVGGFGLSGTSSSTAGAMIDFGVLANRFFVAPPAGSGIASNFQLTVQTAPTTANGVTIPAGLYVDSAFITNVNALWGRFGTLVADSIQATAISASQLTAGNGVIGGSLKSANYVSGSSGWTLRPDGVAEFSGVIVRGTVYATSGTVGGWSIGINYLRSSNYVPGSAGVSLGSNGTVEIRSADGSRVFNLQAAGAQPLLKVPGLEILGNGSAAFSGTLTAANVVGTAQLVPGSVTASAASYLTDTLSFRYDTEVVVASVVLETTGSGVLVLAGLSLEVTNGRITSSYNPRCVVRLRRNGTEVRRVELRGEYGGEPPAMAYQKPTWIRESPVALLPLVDNPPSGTNTYTITLTVAGMDTDVNITVRQRSMAVLEMKR